MKTYTVQNETAFRKGAQDYLDGKPVASNPYFLSSKKVAWLAGWLWKKGDVGGASKPEPKTEEVTAPVLFSILEYFQNPLPEPASLDQSQERDDPPAIDFAPGGGDTGGGGAGSSWDAQDSSASSSDSGCGASSE